MTAGESIVLRPEVGHANVAALRNAYARMQALSATDNRSWIYWAGYHGFNRFDCWHHARTGSGNDLFPYDLFLPWHRAYLVNWDHATRDQDPVAILPWWDWTSATSHQVGVPAAYAAPEAGGKSNPLASGPTPAMPKDPARRTLRFPGDPGELPSMDRDTAQNPAIDKLLAATSYTDFSNRLQDVHDFIHGWTGGIDPKDQNVGGDMGNIGVAAFDPIFWAHHAMIDRLWYLWQQRHGVNNIPAGYLDKVLAPFNFTVRQVLDVHQLGYDYAAASVSTPAAASVSTPAAASVSTPAAASVSTPAAASVSTPAAASGGASGAGAGSGATGGGS